MRFALTVVAIVGSIVAGALTPIAIANGAPPMPHPNEWLGLRTGAADGVEATCALGGAASSEQSVSTWVAVGGQRFLDVIQIGAKATPFGHRYFAAHGRGEPSRAGSMYVEQDLGPADDGPHTFQLRLAGTAWLLLVDGRERLRVDDAFRTWAVESVQVMHEAEGERDGIGGTPEHPVRCFGARVHRLGWTAAAWQLWGYGPTALTARIQQGLDSFAAWR